MVPRTVSMRSRTPRSASSGANANAAARSAALPCARTPYCAVGLMRSACAGPGHHASHVCEIGQGGAIAPYRGEGVDGHGVAQRRGVGLEQAAGVPRRVVVQPRDRLPGAGLGDRRRQCLEVADVDVQLEDTAAGPGELAGDGAGARRGPCDKREVVTMVREHAGEAGTETRAYADDDRVRAVRVVVVVVPVCTVPVGLGALGVVGRAPRSARSAAGGSVGTVMAARRRSPAVPYRRANPGVRYPEPGPAASIRATAHDPGWSSHLLRSGRRGAGGSGPGLDAPMADDPTSRSQRAARGRQHAAD